jgi:hypothetical protein
MPTHLAIVAAPGAARRGVQRAFDAHATKHTPGERHCRAQRSDRLAVQRRLASRARRASSRQPFFQARRAEYWLEASRQRGSPRPSVTRRRHARRAFRLAAVATSLRRCSRALAAVSSCWARTVRARSIRNSIFAIVDQQCANLAHEIVGRAGVLQRLRREPHRVRRASRRADDDVSKPKKRPRPSPRASRGPGARQAPCLRPLRLCCSR